MKIEKKNNNRKTNKLNFNTSLLRDKLYLDEINELIDCIIVVYVVFPYAMDSINNVPKNKVQLFFSDDIFGLRLDEYSV